MSTIDMSFAARRWPATAGTSSDPWRPRLQGLVDRVAARITMARRVRRDTGTILSLNDRMLRDIGLTRAHIERRSHFGRW